MSEVVEVIANPDGSRVLVYDDGSRVTELAEQRIVGERGTSPLERGLGDSPWTYRERATADSSAMLDPGSPGDLAFLRQAILSGAIYRESRSVLVTEAGTLALVASRAGWSYCLGGRGVQVAYRIVGRVGGLPTLAREAYPWAVLGSYLARQSWRRDLARTGGLPGTSGELADVLADTGLPPAAATAATRQRTPPPSLADLSAELMLISSAALHAPASLRRDISRRVAEYNDEPYGSAIGVIAGILEFILRFLISLPSLPAALQEACNEAGVALRELQQSIPDLVSSLREAPAETVSVVLEATMEALSSLSGIADAVDEVHGGLRAAGEGRSAESSLAITRATGRVIELLLVVQALAATLRLIPTIAARMRAGLRWLTSSTRGLREARTALRAEGVPDTRTGHPSPTPARVPETDGSPGTPRAELPDETPAASPPEPPPTPEPSRPATLPLLLSATVHEALDRVFAAARTGGEIAEADVQTARRLQEQLAARRRTGGIPAELARDLGDVEDHIALAEAVIVQRQLAAEGARIFASGGRARSMTVGAAGEAIVRRILESRGYRNLTAVINASNNGLDLIGTDRLGAVRLFEVKASAGERAPPLSAAQRNCREFVLSRLRRIALGQGVYRSATAQMVRSAQQTLRALESQGFVGGAVMEVTHVFDGSRLAVRSRIWRRGVAPRSAAWWRQLFARMGLQDGVRRGATRPRGRDGS